MERSRIGPEIHELKLGQTFSPQNNKTAFHTLKYDFKPASVDCSKVANVDVSPNNQVTVTVPNLESSGVPHTVFKGNQRKYTKEFVLIYDKQTNTMTLEKLNHNILVKKTRTEPPPNKNPVAAPPPKQLENSTQRTSSKTRVSTGARKNAIIGFTPRTMQGSPPATKAQQHRSPQSAPVWNAHSGQSTLPSIPMIELDEDVDRTMRAGASMPNVLGNSNSMEYQHQSSSGPHQLQQQQQQQQQHHHMQQQYHHANNSIPSHNSYSGSNGSMMMQNHSAGSTSLAASATRLEEEIGELSTSDSSSDSESSGSGSDSDDSDNELPNKMNTQPQQQQQQQQQQQSYVNGSALILHDDLQLSESNSSDSDDD